LAAVFGKYNQNSGEIAKNDEAGRAAQMFIWKAEEEGRKWQ
jgi:hypothetical protein